MLKSPLGKLLRKNSAISAEDYSKAMEHLSVHAASFVKNTVLLDVADDEAIADLIAKNTGIERAPDDLLAYTEEKAVECLGPALMTRFEAVPLSLTDRKLQVAVADPLDTVTLRQIEFLTEKKVVPVISSLSQIRRALAHLVKNFAPPASPLEQQRLSESQENIPGYIQAAKQELEHEASLQNLSIVELESQRRDESEYVEINFEDIDDMPSLPEVNPSKEENLLDEAKNLPQLDGDDSELVDFNDPLNPLDGFGTTPGFDINAQAVMQENVATDAPMSIHIEEPMSATPTDDLSPAADFDLGEPEAINEPEESSAFSEAAFEKNETALPIETQEIPEPNLASTNSSSTALPYARLMTAINNLRLKLELCLSQDAAANSIVQSLSPYLRSGALVVSGANHDLPSCLGSWPASDIQLQNTLEKIDILTMQGEDGLHRKVFGGVEYALITEGINAELTLLFVCEFSTELSKAAFVDGMRKLLKQLGKLPTQADSI